MGNCRCVFYVLTLMKKTIVITGATNGIGASTAHALAKKDYHLILTGRSESKLAAMQQEIARESDNDHIETVWMPQDELSRVNAGAEEILNKTNQIDVLINNAGAIFTDYSETKDGIESSFGVNHLSHFLLTEKLLPALKSSHNARIINVASEAHRGANYSGSWIPKKDGYFGFSAYALSKLANIVYSYELAKRLSPDGIMVSSLHPGVVKTGFASDSSGIFSWVFNVIRPFMISADKGAETSIYLADTESLSGKSGDYYVKKKPKNPIKLAHDSSAAKLLWKESEALISKFL